MTKVFADTGFWYALANKDDGLHQIAKQLHQDYKAATIVTTDEVLSEFLGRLSTPKHRPIALALLEVIRTNRKVEVREQSRTSFNNGLEIYLSRADNSSSLVDYVSFLVMHEEKIYSALAHDRDFEQEGFKVLMRLE